jgi:hypothetical protein
MARFACTAKAAVIQRLPESRRLATLVAFVMNLEASALDDSLDLLDILITDMLTDAERASERARLRTIKDLDSAAIQISQVGRLVLDDDVPDSELRAAIFAALKREDLESVLTRSIPSLAHPRMSITRNCRIAIHAFGGSFHRCFGLCNLAARQPASRLLRP